jgi:hypothetical protein
LGIASPSVGRTQTNIPYHDDHIGNTAHYHHILGALKGAEKNQDTTVRLATRARTKLAALPKMCKTKLRRSIGAHQTYLALQNSQARLDCLAAFLLTLRSDSTTELSMVCPFVLYIKQYIPAQESRGEDERHQMRLPHSGEGGKTGCKKSESPRK